MLTDASTATSTQQQWIKYSPGGLALARSSVYRLFDAFGKAVAAQESWDAVCRADLALRPLNVARGEVVEMSSTHITTRKIHAAVSSPCVTGMTF